MCFVCDDRMIRPSQDSGNIIRCFQVPPLNSVVNSDTATVSESEFGSPRSVSPCRCRVCHYWHTILRVRGAGTRFLSVSSIKRAHPASEFVYHRCLDRLDRPRAYCTPWTQRSSSVLGSCQSEDLDHQVCPGTLPAFCRAPLCPCIQYAPRGPWNAYRKPRGFE